MQNTTDLVMPAAIGLIMFGIGLELKFKNFRRVILEPGAILVGLIAQILLLPLTALALVYFWPIDPLYKVGIMLLAACPGGTTSNLLTKILKGRVALSVSLTAFNSFVVLFTIPLIVELSYTLFAEEIRKVELGFWTTMREILWTVIFPVLAGMIINKLTSGKLSARLHKPLKFILPALLLIAFTVVLFFDKDGRNIDYLQHLHLFVPLVLFNILSMLVAFFSAKAVGLGHKSNYTIAVEMGLKNSVLALYIANQLLRDPLLSLVAILYGLFSLLSTLGLGYLLKRWKS